MTKLLRKHFLRSLIGFVMLLTVLTACSKEKVAEVPALPGTPMDTVPGNNASTYLALGDSYTIGASVNFDERFPTQAAASVRASGLQVNMPEFRAVTGWTTGDLLNGLISNPPGSRTYDFVTLLIGVNNQYRGLPREEYQAQFTQLLNMAITYAAGRTRRVCVLSIPDYSVTPFAQNADTARISGEIDALNNINRQVSIQAGVQYLDITNISREGRADPGMQAPDGLHPSGKQYQRWATLLAPIMKAEL